MTASVFFKLNSNFIEFNQIIKITRSVVIDIFKSHFSRYGIL